MACRPTSWKAMFWAEWRADGGDRHGREHAVGEGGGPFQHLHAAHRAADHAEQSLDAQMVKQPRLDLHHVADGDAGEGQAPGLAGGGIYLFRPGGSHAAAEHVGTDQEIAVGVENAAGTDHLVPPSRLAGERMDVGHEMVAGQGVTDQDGVRPLGVEFAIGLVGHGDRPDVDAAVEAEWPIRAQHHLEVRADGRFGGKLGTAGSGHRGGQQPREKRKRLAMGRRRGCQRFL